MPIVESSANESWLSCVNSTSLGQPKNPFKLRIFLPVEQYDAYNEPLYTVLRTAVDLNVLWGFKRINIGCQLDLQAYSEKNPSNIRFISNPFVMYLPVVIDYQAVAQLCHKIEGILKQVATTDKRSTLSDADIDLECAEHISFRLEHIKNEYVAIKKATTEQLYQLKKMGESSEVFEQLNKALRRDLPPIYKTDQYVKQFYREHFAHVRNGLDSMSLYKQFVSACHLLYLEPIFLKNEVKSDLEAIKKAYNQACKKFHDDKLHAADAKQCGRELFHLVKNAKDILDRVARDPKMLEYEGGTVVHDQRAYEQQYDYELNDGCVEDSSYYVEMAKSSKEYILTKKSGVVSDDEEEVTVPITHGSGAEHSDRSVVIHMRKREKSLNEVIRVPGYEAFELLQTAGALPYRFDQYHLERAYSESPYLRHKILKKPVVMKLRSYVILDALKWGKLANDGISAFEHFYINDPEVLDAKHIEDWLNLRDYVPGLSPEQVDHIKHLILFDHQESLDKLSGDALIVLMRLCQPLREHLLNSPEKCKRLVAYFLRQSSPYITPWYGADGFRCCRYGCFWGHVVYQVLMGNVALFHLLSDAVRKRLLNDLDGRRVSKCFYSGGGSSVANLVPDWMVDELKEDFDSFDQSNPRDAFKDCPQVSSRRVEAFTFVQGFFLAKMRSDQCQIKLVLEEFACLSDKCLANLAKQPRLWQTEKKALTDFITARADGSPGSVNYDALQHSHDGEKQAIIGHWKSKVEGLKPKDTQLLGEVLREFGEEARVLCMVDQFEKVILQPIKDDLSQRFDSICSELKSGDVDLAAQTEAIVRFGKAVDDVLCEDWQNCFAIKLSLVVSDLENAVRVVIGVFNADDSIEQSMLNSLPGFSEDYGLEFPVYGVKDKKQDVLDSLCALHGVFRALQKEASFFDYLSNRLQCENDWRSAPDFDGSEIKRAVSDYLQNELYVFADGYRENARYKTHVRITSLYGSNNAVLPFQQIWETCQRFNCSDDIERILPDVFLRLEQQDQAVSAKPIHYPRFECLPIERYLSIRACGVLSRNAALDRSAARYLGQNINGSAIRYRSYGSEQGESQNAIMDRDEPLALTDGSASNDDVDGWTEWQRTVRDYRAYLTRVTTLESLDCMSKRSATQSLAALNSLCETLGHNFLPGANETPVLGALKAFGQATRACPKRQMALKIIAGVLFVAAIFAIVIGTGGAASIPLGVGAVFGKLSFVAKVASSASGCAAAAIAAPCAFYGRRTEYQKKAQEVYKAASALKPRSRSGRK